MGDINQYGIAGVEGIRPASIAEMEEHGNVGGNDRLGPGYKLIGGAPLAYKAFPSLASGYTFHATAPVGSTSAASIWRLFREEKATGTIDWADGDFNWDNDLSDVTSSTYS